MQWAFWRRERSEPVQPLEAAPLPDDTGLPPGGTGRVVRAAPDDADRGEDDRAPGAAASPSSGARPDPAGAPPTLPHAPPPVLPAPAVDEPEIARHAELVAQLVRAVLAVDAAAVDAALAPLDDPTRARAAAAAAAGALAARLPPLSGLEGAVTFDEDEGDLLHAYADLLTARAEQRRTSVAPVVTREQLMVVAHLAAAAAVGDAASEPSLLVLAGIPAREQLLAGCVLLAQTSVDGGGGADDVAREVAALFG